MSLQRRSFLFVLAVVLGTSLLATAITTRLTFDALGGVEREQAANSVESIVDLLDLERIKLDGTVQDWGAWDETYDWGLGDDTYPERNFQAATLLSIDVDYVAGVDAQGTVLFTGRLDRDASQTVAAPPGWDELFGPGSPLVGLRRDGDAAAGYVSVDGEGVLLAARPMLPRDRSGGATGTLVFGRALDANRVGIIEEIVGYDVDIATSMADRRAGPTAVEATEDSITAARALDTIAGPGHLMVTATTDRPIRPVASRTTRLQLWLVLGTGLLSALAAAWFADRRLLRRVSRIGSEVATIGATAEPGARVTVDDTDDELAGLAEDINTMLAGLEQVQQLRTRNAELVNVDRIRNEFVSMVSHELRTPLTAVMGFAETLHERWEAVPPPQRRQMVDRIRRHGDQLLTIVNDLLTLTQLQSGAVDVDPQRVDLRAALHRVRDDYPGLAAEVIVDVPQGMAVEVTPQHLEQCLVNLLSNADKYGRAPIVIDAQDDQGFVQVRVTDRGDGVPDAAAATIFEPFSQVSQGTRREAQGVGLGLAIIRLLMFANGGYAHYEQASHGGARFVLTVPEWSPTGRSAAEANEIADRADGDTAATPPTAGQA